MRVEPCKLITPISIRFVVPRRLCYNIALYNENTIIQTRPAVMAVWAKALPLTVSCLSPLSKFYSHAGHVRKLPVTCG